jgi:ribosome-binding protein aMBF1 (putative translation factor)
MTMPWLARNLRVGTRRAAMGRKKKGPAEGVSPRARQFAEHLDALLQKRGLSATDLAMRLGLAPVTVYSYLQGRSMPAVRELPLLRESLTDRRAEKVGFLQRLNPACSKNALTK